MGKAERVSEKDYLDKPWKDGVIAWLGVMGEEVVYYGGEKGMDLVG